MSAIAQAPEAESSTPVTAGQEASALGPDGTQQPNQPAGSDGPVGSGEAATPIPTTPVVGPEDLILETPPGTGSQAASLADRTNQVGDTTDYEHLANEWASNPGAFQGQPDGGNQAPASELILEAPPQPAEPAPAPAPVATPPAGGQAPPEGQQPPEGGQQPAPAPAESAAPEGQQAAGIFLRCS